MDRTKILSYATGALLTALLATPAMAVLPTTPDGGFVALVDKQNNHGDSRKSIVFYSTQDMSTPLFAVFSGEKLPSNNRSPNSITVDPNTGDIYFLADDRDQVAGFQYNPTPADAADGILPNTEGDHDLLKIPFTTLFNDWVTNQGQAYTTYNPGAFGHPTGQNTNEVTFAGAVEKIGEIARPINADFFDTHIEFVDQNTMLIIDSPIAAASVPANNIPANDSQIRALVRVSTLPGAATTNPGLTEGGYNQGTTESWESVVLGQVQMDPAGAFPGSVSEVSSIAYYKDAATGVEGLWIVESDADTIGTPTGDDVSFFQITNFAGTAGNAMKEMNVGAGPVFPTGFTADNNPSVNSLENLGDVSRIFVDKNGNLVMVENGYADTLFTNPNGDGIDQNMNGRLGDEERGLLAFGAHENTVYTRAITSYNDINNRIDFGAWGANQNLVMGALPDDDPLSVVDSRWAVYDAVNNDIYFMDTDNFEGAFPQFGNEWYKLDLDTGVTTQEGGLNSDFSNGLFGNGDQFAFFCLGASCNPVVALDGDYNGDGFVGIDDLNLVLVNWNQNVTPGDLGVGDGDGSGFIGVDDLNIVLVNWNNGTPPASGAAIPEPASLALFTMAGLSVLARRRSKA